MARRVIRQYEFLRKIGSGGSGVVYLANDTLLQRPRRAQAPQARFPDP